MVDRAIELAAINDAWIYTYTGKELHPLSARPEQICIRDIAHALSRMCRFNGHTIEHYSIAQHSVLVSQYCNPEDSLHGLLHDSSEFCIADICAPIKRTTVFQAYLQYEKLLSASIYKKFGLTETEPRSVKQADIKILATEAISLLKQPLPSSWQLPVEPYDFKIEPLSSEQSEELFLQRFQQLVSADQYQKWMAE